MGKRKSTGGENTPKKVQKVSVEGGNTTTATPKSTKKNKPAISTPAQQANGGTPNTDKKKRSKKAKVEVAETMETESSVEQQTSEASPETTKKSKAAQNRKGAKVRLIDAKERQKSALEYLEQWENDKSNWRFNKKWQKALFNTMLDSNKVPKASFTTLLKYIEPLKGSARPEVIKTVTEELEKQNAKEKTEQDNSVVNRCERIIKVLN